MPRSNVELVHAGYELWNRDDLEGGGLALMHPDLEWWTSGEFPGLELVYRGHDGYRQFWDDMKAPWEYFTIHVERMSERGDRVVAEVLFEAVGKGSGVKVELGFVNLWGIEDGLIRRFTARRSLEEALAAPELPGRDA